MMPLGRPIVPTALLLVGGVFLGTAACGAQLGGGITSSSAVNPDRSLYMTTAIQTQNIRTNGSLVGLRATWLPDPSGLHARNAVMAFGYDLHTGASVPLGLEGSVELGAGGSAHARFDGIGMYTGLSITPRLRLPLLASRDLGAGYNLLMSYCDLVLTGRAGMWAPPENPDHHQSYGEWAIETGIRITLASDAVNAPSQSVRTDPDPEGVK
jgi:hypothetical protein